MRAKDFAFGFCAAIAGRALIPKLLLLKFGRDVKRLNEGDYSGLLAAYSEDFVLHFNEGDHRWSGDWIGKAGMERLSASSRTSPPPASRARSDRSRSAARHGP